jgi:hypothetical protein
MRRHNKEHEIALGIGYVGSSFFGAPFNLDRCLAGLFASATSRGARRLPLEARYPSVGSSLT